MDGREGEKRRAAARITDRGKKEVGTVVEELMPFLNRVTDRGWREGLRPIRGDGFGSVGGEGGEACHRGHGEAMMITIITQRWC